MSADTAALASTVAAAAVVQTALVVDQAEWSGPYITPRSESASGTPPFETPPAPSMRIMETPLLAPETDIWITAPTTGSSTLSSQVVGGGFLLPGQRSAQDLIYSSSRDLPILPINPREYDYSRPPGPEWEWRGPVNRGAWFNPHTREYLRKDEIPHDGYDFHFDWRDSDGLEWRIFPDGTIQSKD